MDRMRGIDIVDHSTSLYHKIRLYAPATNEGYELWESRKTGEYYADTEHGRLWWSDMWVGIADITKRLMSGGWHDDN